MHIGLYCPAETGHLNTMLPLGEALQNRGHRVTFVGIEDARSKVEAAGIDFFPIAAEALPAGTMEELFKAIGELQGVPALVQTIRAFRDTSAAVLQDAPIACRSLDLDGLLVDQSTSDGAAIAQFLGIPYVTLCSALPFNSEPEIPPMFTTWAYGDSWLAKLRNLAVDRFAGSLAAAAIRVPIQKFLTAHNLPFSPDFDSPIAVLCHQPRSFEFPRTTLPAHFHFTGPYHTTTSRKPVDFPWDRLTGKPLVYASMGTLQNRLGSIFQAIAAACAPLDAQLVISLGGSGDPADLPPLAGEPIVVRYAPQIELLKQATLTITHAGMNTTLESLTHGVPLVAIPVTNDQPGIAARIQWTGAGEFVPLGQLDAAKLQPAIERVLQMPRYREAAQRLQREIAASGGVDLAVSIVERALTTRQPVMLESLES